MSVNWMKKRVQVFASIMDRSHNFLGEGREIHGKNTIHYYFLRLGFLRPKINRSGICVVIIISLTTLPMAYAQSSGDASTMWGTSASSSSYGKDRHAKSSQMHVSEGIIAGQVNAARDGILYQGSSISVTAVGTQNIVSTTIIGDDNRADVSADQRADNSGSVTNNAELAFE